MDNLLLTDIINETPKKKSIASAQSFTKDIVKHLAIITPGSINSAEPSSFEFHKKESFTVTTLK